MDLALNILIPGSRWSETEKAKVSKLIGERIIFFPSSSLFLVTVSLRVPLNAPHSNGRSREGSRGHPSPDMLLLGPGAGPGWQKHCQALCVLQENPWGKSLSFSWRADLLPLSSFSKRKLCILDTKSLSTHKLTSKSETINLRYWLHQSLAPCPWTVLNLTWFVFIRSPDAEEKQKQEHKL